MLITDDETDIVVTPKGKVILILQHCMVWIVIHDSFDILYSLLLSEHAFPNGGLTILLIKEALVRFSQIHLPHPHAICIQEWLHDQEYFGLIMPLVSLVNIHGHSSWRYPQLRVRISTFQSQVKDQCCTLIESVMVGIGEPSEIEKFVDKQLWNYMYIYPNALGMSIHLTLRCV